MQNKVKSSSNKIKPGKCEEKRNGRIKQYYCILVVLWQPLF